MEPHVGRDQVCLVHPITPESGITLGAQSSLRVNSWGFELNGRFSELVNE